jgi:hypothetical protein
MTPNPADRFDDLMAQSSAGRRPAWWKSQPCQMLAYLAGALLLAAVLGLCAGCSLPGKLYALEDGTVLEFSIERSHGTGQMHVRNLGTGEVFEGQYTGITKGGGVLIGTGFNQQTGQSTTTTGFMPATHANAGGVLIGDHGTVIELEMEIKPGPRPRGYGSGRDNQGRRYQVQF